MLDWSCLTIILLENLRQYYPILECREPGDPNQAPMQRLNNRSESHLSGQVECELDSLGKGSWVNQGYCGSPTPIPRAISTVYNPQPLYPQGSFDSMCKLTTPSPFPTEVKPLETGSEKKRGGCCSFFKGRNWFATVCCCCICICFILISLPGNVIKLKLCTD